MERRFRGLSANRGNLEFPTYFFFANDSIIFGDAIRSEAAEVRRILNTYELASSQKLNLDKRQMC